MSAIRQPAQPRSAGREHNRPARQGWPPLAARYTGLKRRAAAFLVSHRHIIIAGVLVFLLIIEGIEHLVIAWLGQDRHLIFDFLVYLLLVPTGLWLLLSLLEHTVREREQAALESDQRLAFSHRLGQAASWEELLRLLVEYPHQVAPSARVTLYVFNPLTDRMEPEVSCQPDGTLTLKPAAPLNPDSQPVGSLPQLLLQQPGDHPFLNRRHYPAPAALPPHRYDLPVTRNDQLIGVFKLEYPLGQAPTQAETAALQAVAPIMALALEAGVLENLAAEQAAASATQRQQIAQTLHDTLAQNISYLRLKLDLLTGENAIHEIGAVLQELERMRAAADEAYQQVRSTLDDLIPIQGQDLASLLRAQAGAIAARAGLALDFDQDGTAFPLPSATRQQILYILREALHNVEKHAQAARVHLRLAWQEDGLLIKMSDDGVGFDHVPNGKHFGLQTMRERAESVGGGLTVTSLPSRGTQVTFWLPLAQP